MRFCSIASGSSGNCIYAGSDCTHLLIDVGISGKRIEEGLKDLNLSMRDLSGILITHEHIDHIKSLGMLSRKYDIPIFATKGTIEGIKATKSVGDISPELFNIIRADEAFFIKDMKVNPIRISHDANEPTGFKVCDEGKSAAIITDLGTYNDYIVNCLKGTDVLLCEANHDIRMLQVGPYPYYLKQRILSDHGHLSNENCGKMVSSLLHDGIKEIILGHLSKENNIPELAYETVRLEIEASDTPYHGNDFPIRVAKRDMPLAPVEI